MKRFISFALAILMSFSLVGCCNQVAAYEIIYDNVVYSCSDYDTLNENIRAEELRMDAAHQMAESARALGYNESHEVIQLAGEEWRAASERKAAYQQVLNTLEAHWLEKKTEYPAATYVWSYFKNLGYSDYVCAGIMGNLMVEVGGRTLDLQYGISGNGYYGMCQWNKVYSSEVWGASLEEQCAFLQKTIKYEIDMFGYAYQKGFTYDGFMSLTSCKQAALAFAKCYERCGSSTYLLRQQCATKAYNYFIS